MRERKSYFKPFRRPYIEVSTKINRVKKKINLNQNDIQKGKGVDLGVERSHRTVCRIPPGILIVSCLNKDYLANYLENKTGTAIGYGMFPTYRLSQNQS